MGYARELRRLMALAEQLRGPMVTQVQNAVARHGDPGVQLERRRARLERRRVWAGRWATVWALISVIGMLLAVSSFLGITDDPNNEAVVVGIVLALISGTFAVRAGLRMGRLAAQRDAIDAVEPAVTFGTAARAVRVLPPKSSAARTPMERLADAESTLTELLAQITRAGAVPAESVEHTRQTGADAALVLRQVAAQLHAVERARDHAPHLERGPLADAVRRLRKQLDEGVDGYCSLLAAAGRVLAASTLGEPKRDLTEATEHLAGLALALRELSPER
ncbi:MAG: phage shock envelope stress response protein PspM [Labedaea sp.]